MVPPYPFLFNKGSSHSKSEATGTRVVGWSQKKKKKKKWREIRSKSAAASEMHVNLTKSFLSQLMALRRIVEKDRQFPSTGR